MKPIFLLSSFVIAVCVVGQTVQQSTNPPTMKDAEKFISVPTDGFKTMEEMSAFAASSSHGSGFVEKMSIAGESVFVMRRSISWGGSTAEITFFRESQGRFLPALTMPMTIGEFRVEQRGDGIVVSRSDGKKRLDVFQIYRLP